jgi:hypothetical protein
MPVTRRTTAPDFACTHLQGARQQARGPFSGAVIKLRGKSGRGVTVRR